MGLVSKHLPPEWPDTPLLLMGKLSFARLAGARKRHYTFARRVSAVFLVEPAR